MGPELNYQSEAKTILQWYIDHGVNECISDESVDRFALKLGVAPIINAENVENSLSSNAYDKESVNTVAAVASTHISDQSSLLGASEAAEEAKKIARNCNSLEELSQAIENFEGISLKKTATNMVFADGNPSARIMVIGDAPVADDDRQGKPFMGENGQLLDRMFSCIDLYRHSENPAKSIYISNILNWRPPGNRSPSPGEIEVSLPFIEKHIALINPEILVLCGGVAAKSLLKRTESISRLRGNWYEYSCSTLNNGDSKNINTIVTFHPSYLLRTAIQKRVAWKDLLSIQGNIKPL